FLSQFLNFSIPQFSRHRSQLPWRFPDLAARRTATHRQDQRAATPVIAAAAAARETVAASEPVPGGGACGIPPHGAPVRIDGHTVSFGAKVPAWRLRKVSEAAPPALSESQSHQSLPALLHHAAAGARSGCLFRPVHVASRRRAVRERFSRLVPDAPVQG